MANTDHTRSGGKSGKRKRERQGSQKLEQPRSAMPEQLPDATEPSEAAVAATDTSSMTDAATAPTDTSPVGEAVSAKTSPIGAAASANASPVGLQTIASAYRDYTKKSFADAQCFVEKLSGARSLDKALEVQTEF